MNFTAEAVRDECIEPDLEPFVVNPTFEFNSPQWLDFSDDPALCYEEQDDGFCFDYEHPSHESQWKNYNLSHIPSDRSPGYLRPLHSFSYSSDTQSPSPVSPNGYISAQRSHVTTNRPNRLPQRLVIPHEEKPHEHTQGATGFAQHHAPYVGPHVRIASIAVTESVEEEEEGTEESEEESSDGESMDLVSALLREHNSKVKQTRKRDNKKMKEPGKVTKPRARKTAGSNTTATTGELAGGVPNEEQAQAAPPPTHPISSSSDTVVVKETTRVLKHNTNAPVPKVSRVVVAVKEVPQPAQLNVEGDNGGKRKGIAVAKPPPTTALRVTSTRPVLTSRSGVVAAAKKTEPGAGVKTTDVTERPKVTKQARPAGGVSALGVSEPVLLKGKPATTLPNKAGTAPSPPTGASTLKQSLPATQAPAHSIGAKFAPAPQPSTRTQTVTGSSVHLSVVPGAQKPTLNITRTIKPTAGEPRIPVTGRLGAGVGLTGAGGVAKKPSLYTSALGEAHRSNIENVVPRSISSISTDKYSRDRNADIENMTVYRDGAVAKPTKAATNQMPARGLAHRAPLHDRNHNQLAVAPTFPSKPENRTKATLTFCPSGSQPTKPTLYGHVGKDTDTDDLKHILAQHNSRVTGMPTRKFL
eukprot:comp17982_c0_seq1/m.18377 comp17982_c0_seq1/g.18377  ORF comp17982_c0_seq1/g.18377 comp17982_c0_seq1/m.18377 type:complete len:640 (-) comp17982_c0_seq1:330-2249(-)